jgi:O-acetyl-ADP-ribose deacetylase (regulator of RNase III)
MKQYLVDGLRECITKAEAANCTSIAFPAVGTGHLKYPTDEVAACFWKVSKNKAAGSINQVRFLS